MQSIQLGEGNLNRINGGESVKRIIVIMIGLISISAYCKESLTLYAAASTTEVVQELSREYEKLSGRKIHINLASSGSLAKQMESGAPVDVYISASKKWAEYLLGKKLLKHDYYAEFMYNSLVLVTSKDSSCKSLEINRALAFPDLVKDRIAIGNPAHVPVGKYAAQSIRFYGWDFSSEQYLYCKSTRAVLMTAELGEVDFGIVYQTDAMQSKKVKIVGVFPEESHIPITYYAGVAADAKKSALEFYKFLLSERAKKIYAEHGFLTELPKKEEETGKSD